VTTSITCPHCGKIGSTQMPLTASKKVRCPSCRQPFQVSRTGTGPNPDPTPLPDPPSNDVDDEDLATPPRVDSPDAVSLAPQPPTPIIFASARPTKPRRDTTAKSILLYMLAGVFSIAGLMSLSSGSSDFYPSSYGHRFQSDNAYGATANAVEHLAVRSRGVQPSGWFVAALVCLLIVSVDDLRWSVEHR
jgi:hypothetical protein